MTRIAKPTKSAKLRDLMMRPEGASLARLCKATGWQAHSVRAAISGLRKAGYAVERTGVEDTRGASNYRITTAPETN